MIPAIDFNALTARDPATLKALQTGAAEVGFLTVYNTPLTAARVREVIETYRAFFHRPDAEKARINMAETGSNRGWGAPGSEQVDPMANPDYKQVFDCGFILEPDDPLRAAGLSVYADNQWPDAAFKAVIASYYREALSVASGVLEGIACAMGRDETYFADKFSRPMALLRGNYYPPRPDWAGAKDFGIAAHTDYGCVTLLATDGAPGLEVQMQDGTWLPVQVDPGTFVVNFGEMLEIWTDGAVRATLHRVIGGPEERVSVPLFYNPNHDANVAPPGAEAPILAGAHLAKRFNETYVHLKDNT